MTVHLHIGDKVSHRTLGLFTVFAADEEFCTISFESEDALFRLPDAFEEGFLSSEDAKIIEEEDDDVEEEEVEEDESNEGDEAVEIVQPNAVSAGEIQDKHTKKGITASQVIVAIVMGIFFIPIGYLLFSIGIESFDEFLGMLFTIIGVMFMLGPLIAFIPGLDKVSGSSPGSVFGSSDILSSTDSDVHKSNWLSDEDSVREDIYAKQDEDLSILEDMIQMHSVNPDADLEEHYGWDHKIDFDQDGDNGGW